MSTYLIGDIHGCYEEFKIMLETVRFNPAIDRLWLTGDLVARGPNSLEVLRLIRNLGHSVRIVLGNHDLHLLAVHFGIIQNQLEDCITSFLEAPDANELANWLRYQPMLQIDKEKKLVMVHAGIAPQWNINIAQLRAREIEIVLQSNDYLLFLNSIFRDHSKHIKQKKLNNLMRLKFSNNVFTLMRYCFPNGQLEMHCKDTPSKAPRFLYPWFSLSGSVLEQHYSIVFGHWATLMGKGTPPNVYGLDTGCCWGGKLTLMRWEDKQFFHVPSFKRFYQPNIKTFIMPDSNHYS
ncbi:bis(5'-nucleosyl)-tetraphosphatase (symmetrical) ApaH [Candidatus Curculioniphilus buchneri]|uniref:bis(5'-nucleosyl)-tetraphosphatase (symmetrical) ApaH n=1 Tax=Candidatus Curculioniphilus buchneri TaxID=690594 RepID=UPI00376EBC0E